MIAYLHFLFSLVSFVFVFNWDVKKLSTVFISGRSHSTANKAFLFSFYNAKGYNPVKLTQYRNQQYTMYGHPDYGPTFGSGHGIYISKNALNNQASHTRCGYTYSVPSGYSAGDCGFFTGGSSFTPTDIEVFYEIGNWHNSETDEIPLLLPVHAVAANNSLSSPFLR